MSCQVVGHLMSCSSSATSASLVEHRALRTLATRKLLQQTLEHILTFVAKRSLPILKDTLMDMALTEYMFGAHHHLGNTLMAALMHKYPRYSRHGGGKLPRSHRCLRGWKLLTPGRTRKAFSLRRGYQSQQNWSRRVVAAWALSYKEDKDARGLPFSYHQVWTDFLKVIPQPSKRHSVPSSTFWPQHRSSYERKAPQRMQTRASSATRKALVWQPIIWRCLVERES